MRVSAITGYRGGGWYILDGHNNKNVRDMHSKNRKKEEVEGGPVAESEHRWGSRLL